MSHDHHHAPTDFGRAFGIGILLNGGFIILEVVFGLWSDSLALLADAGHNLSDVLGLVLAWAANELAKKAASERRTYGWRRSTVLAALFNALLLMLGLGAILFEAVKRLREPAEVAGGTVIWVAALGILVNGATAWLFYSGRKSDLNVRGAFLHMAADAGVSAGVMISGAVILWTGWTMLDPLVSIVVAVFILFGTWELFKDSMNLSLDAVPENVDPAAVKSYLASVEGIRNVHHLHIWALSTTEVALTVHLVKNDAVLDNELLHKIEHELHDRFEITHATIQWEAADPHCGGHGC